MSGADHQKSIVSLRREQSGLRSRTKPSGKPERGHWEQVMKGGTNSCWASGSRQGCGHSHFPSGGRARGQLPGRLASARRASPRARGGTEPACGHRAHGCCLSCLQLGAENESRASHLKTFYKYHADIK